MDSPPDNARPGRIPTVLIVDDNEQNRELLIAYLEPLDVRLRTAADGIEALASVEAEPPDVILLDIMMPRMSGFEVCQRLKRDPATTDIPIVMVTALSEISDIERAAEAGTNEFISKPVNKVELLTRVRNLLDHRRLRLQLADALAQLHALDPTARGI